MYTTNGDSPGHTVSRQVYGWMLTLAAALTGCGAAQASEFEYSGDTGPGFWGETPGWEACGATSETARQTPIDIRRARPSPRLKPLDLRIFDSEIALINNGHVIEQEYHNGSTLTLDGVDYELLQFHFHTLTEHTIDGDRGRMELHAVFRDMSSGNLAVVGKIYQRGPRDRFLRELVAAGLPRKGGDHTEAHVEINLEDALGDTSEYYTYVGSLTTPPCSEIVTWFVLKEQATVSDQQFRAFNDIMGNNFRPLQARNGRPIFMTTRHKKDED